MTAPGTEFVLTLSCDDRAGIVHRVSGFLAAADFTIVDSQQFADPESHRFFMRVHVASCEGAREPVEVRDAFAEVAGEFGMDWELHDVSVPERVLIMVSKQEHCLNDLLFRTRSGSLPVDVRAVVSNHPDLYDLTAWHGIPYHHIPVTPASKPAAEDELRALVDKYSIDTVVLARYMQVLSADLCRDLGGRVINIHHSLLPSFKGARPYAQAYARGVKVIGATAHYVTADLDEGPIIEQDFVRVNHSKTAEQLEAMGRDLEAVALARALGWHAEHRVIRNGQRTVVFT